MNIHESLRKLPTTATEYKAFQAVEQFPPRELGFSRKEVYLPLLFQVGSMTTSQVKRLSELLTDEAEKGSIRPFSAVCLVSGLFDSNQNERIGTDIVLSHTAVIYTSDEGQRPSREDTIPSVDENRAGEGTQRPVLEELYYLASNGQVKVDADTDGEIFSLTLSGKDFVETLHMILYYTPTKNVKPLIICDRTSTVTIPRSVSDRLSQPLIKT